MKKSIVLFIAVCWCVCMHAQFPYGTTGLLHAPSADMQRDKTFMAGASFLDISATPKHWIYGTYNYYVNMTIFPWLEIAYTCTLHKGIPDGYWPEETYGKFTNQDRQFSVRLRAWKEGWWKPWTPQVVLAVNDFTTTFSALDGDYTPDGVGGEGNGYWNRYYMAATKHFDFAGIGNLGAHAAYVYNKREDYHRNGPTLGANFRFHLPETSFTQKALNGLNVIGEYDAHSINIGAEYSFWKDYINAVVELNQCKYFSGGLVFKVHLK